VKFSELTQVALLGTERQALSVATGDSMLDRLLTQLDLNRREEALLSAAALSGLYEENGRLPPRDRAPAPDPCASEGTPWMNERAASLFLRVLGGEYPELLPECLALSARAGWLSFPEALPALLSAGQAKPEWREAILPVLGRRGHWLAAQNPQWSWANGAAADDENIWQVGESAARLLFLQRLRRTNPGRARELLASTWKEESPEDRAGFLACLSIELSASDENFLEAALEDKRKEVLRSAAALLGQLPDSFLVKRMIERTKPRLQYTPGTSGNLLKFKRSKPPVLEITLPSECDKAMQRDGIEPKPPTGLGERICWLMQMLEVTPLKFWTDQWSATPGEILAGSLQGEWQKEVLTAWTRAALRQNNPGWAEALFSVTLETRQFGMLQGLIGALSPEQREARLAALLEADDPNTRELHATLIAQCRHDWSLEFSRRFLSWLRKATAQQSTDWQLRNQIKDFALRLAPATLPEAAHPWPSDSAGWQFWSKGVDEFLAVAQFRSDLHAAFTH